MRDSSGTEAGCETATRHRYCTPRFGCGDASSPTEPGCATVVGARFGLWRGHRAEAKMAGQTRRRCPGAAKSSARRISGLRPLQVTTQEHKSLSAESGTHFPSTYSTELRQGAPWRRRRRRTNPRSCPDRPQSCGQLAATACEESFSASCSPFARCISARGVGCEKPG